MAGGVQIRAADVGKRVTVQYYLDDGTRQETIGMLERAEVDEGRVILHIRRRDESLARVPLDRIRAGKVVRPPRRGT